MKGEKKKEDSKERKIGAMEVISQKKGRDIGKGTEVGIGIVVQIKTQEEVGEKAWRKIKDTGTEIRTDLKKNRCRNEKDDMQVKKGIENTEKNGGRERIKVKNPEVKH